MAKLNGWEETIFLVLILGEHLLLIGLSNAAMVAFFLSGINLSIFLPLNPPRPRCKEQDESHPNPLPHFTFS